MSGLDIRQDGMEWDKDLVQIETKKASSNSVSTEAYNAQSSFQYKFTLKPIYSVAGSREGSPAFLAGIRKDDTILKINNRKATRLSLCKRF
ncbi:hypothetical protein [Halpernia sp. GG3]